MSVFDLLRRFFEPPGMRDPFFGGMTQGEEEEEDDDEDDLFHGPPGGGVQSPLWHGRPPFQDPFGFEDIFRDFNELFADFGSVIGDVPRIAGMEPPGMSPGGCRGRSLRDSMLKYPDSPLPTEPGPTSQDPPTEGPPHADGAIRDRKGWLEDDGGDLPTGSSKQDRVLDSEISSHGLDSVLRSRDPAPSFSFRSVSVSKVLRPDGTVEEKRTVRDSRGNTTTTVTVTRGDEVISTGSIDGPRDSGIHIRADRPSPPPPLCSAMAARSGREKLRYWLTIRNILLRECLAEFLGVFVLLLITVAATAQAVTSQNAKGTFYTAYLGGAIAVVIAIYVSGGVSGGHLNPAYSLSLCVLGRFPWWKLPIYVVIQVVASFTGAAAAFALYYDAIQNYTGGNLTVYGPRETASIFSSYPAPYLSIKNGFLDQVMGTAMLMVGILAILDSRNKPVPKGLEPVVVGMLVFCIGLSMGANCGYPINPSRDLGPRLFTFVAGWGPEVFRAGNNWWWVPIVAPCVGAVFGSLLYEILVEIHHPKRETRIEETTNVEAPEENLKEVPVFTINVENSLSHRL